MSRDDTAGKSLALDAMLDPKRWKEKLEDVQRVIDSATMLHITLHNQFRVWDDYIDLCTQGKEFSIAVGYQSRMMADEIYIHSKDCVLTAQRVRAHPTGDLHGLHIDEIVLNTKTHALAGTSKECTDEVYTEFQDRLRNAEYHTIHGKRADID